MKFEAEAERAKIEAEKEKESERMKIEAEAQKESERMKLEAEKESERRKQEFELWKLEMEHDLRICYRLMQSKMVVVKEECPGVIMAIRLP